MSDPVDIVARQLLANVAGELNWEDMPDVGEYDWLRIVERCKELAPKPDGFAAAIKLLEDSAQEWKKDNDE